LNCAVAKEGFGGEFRFGDMSFIERFITRMIAKADASYSGLDMKKDVSMLDEKSMDRFAQMMNKG
jgi:menaquinone-dependent protoporphyrinogen IX oxidase